MLSNPFGLGLLGFALLGLWLRNRWIAIPASLLWVFVGLALLLDASDPISQFARQEGCVGPPHLSIALAAAITLLSIRAAILGPRQQE